MRCVGVQSILAVAANNPFIRHVCIENRVSAMCRSGETPAAAGRSHTDDRAATPGMSPIEHATERIVSDRSAARCHSLVSRCVTKRRTVNVLGEDVDRTLHVKRPLNCPAKPAYGLAPLQFHVGNLDAGNLASTHVRSVAVFHVKRSR